MLSSRPFSQACENNKQPILSVLKIYFGGVKSVLEIGSGTGQHSVFMASALPHLQWQPSDRVENIEGIQHWLRDQPSDNLLQPIILDVMQTLWPTGYDAVFSANTAHIMSWEQAQVMVTQVANLLPKNGIFVLYGPFKYRGEFTSISNSEFDRSLKSFRSSQGIRDFESVESVANSRSLYLIDDIDMPANNRALVWQKQSNE